MLKSPGNLENGEHLRHSDYTQERFYHIIASYIGGILGFIIAICTMNTAARYVSL
jgi:hypothetical protein